MPKKRLEILGTKYDTANEPAKMRDNYCPHLNPSHRETLLSLHLKYELLWMAHQVTGTGQTWFHPVWYSTLHYSTKNYFGWRITSTSIIPIMSDKKH
jgi:hypothetical protein